MATRLINADPTIQVVGTITSDGLLLSFYSFPSGSVLTRWISQQDYDNDQGKALQESLSAAVEQILGEGEAVFAVGAQTVDQGGFLADNVDFTVRYVPTYQTPGLIEETVRIPVPTLVADTQFGNFLAGGNPADLILAAYNKLKALAGE